MSEWPPDLVVERPGAFDDGLCDLVVGLGLDLLPGAVAREAGEAAHIDSSVRRVRQAVVPRSSETAPVYERVAALAEECNAAFGFDVAGLDEDLVLVDYGPGGFYNWHLDMGPAAPTRKLSISIALSAPDEYEGGGLSFPGRVVESVPRGGAVVFPSFLLHAVKPVKSGRRLALLAWVGGPRFR